MSRLGVVLSTATEAPSKEFVRLGQVAEEKGFDAILVNEGRGDALACAEAIALGTTRIKVGTNIANIYFGPLLQHEYRPVRRIDNFKGHRHQDSCYSIPSRTG